MHPWVVLGVAGSKRTRGLLAASVASNSPVRLVEWRDWLADAGVLDEALLPGCRLKIEPPGDDPSVHLRLLHLGCARLGRPPCDSPERGELASADAWFEGFRFVLRQLEEQLARRADVQAVNAPADIVAMTDKLLCQQRLQSQGVATAPLVGEVSGYDEFIARIERAGLDRVFVKARYGSSAAGVIAYRRNRRGQQQATTSAQVRPGGRLFNVKRICTYQRDDEVRRVIDLVAAQGAYAEAWIPKPRCGAGHFDLRVVTFGGRAAHRVARVGRRPMTNLHLDNERADPALLLPEADVKAAESAAQQASRAFAASGIVGFDLVARKGAAQVLEANAFGDLLPGLLWQGRDTYATAFAEGAWA